MLLQKIWTLNWIDDDNRIQQFTYIKEEQAKTELERLQTEGFDAWLTGKAVPLANSRRS